MMSSSRSPVQEQYLCPICCEVYKSPVVIQTCGHTFCAVCVDGVLPNSDHSRSCPVCRVTFVTRDLRRHKQFERDIAAAIVTCTTCGIKCQLSCWDEHMSTAHRNTQIPTHHQLPRPSQATPNRSTFNCPLCSAGHLSCSDLLAHVNTVHPHSQTPVVCPVCASMPWGVPDQVSQNFVQHLNTRHRFEYDTYVDYNADEEATLLATLKASLTDQ